jgi:hypothetical protein
VPWFRDHLTIRGTFGVIQRTLGVIQGTYGVTQGTFGVIQGTFGVIQGTFGVIQRTFGVFQGTFNTVLRVSLLLVYALTGGSGMQMGLIAIDFAELSHAERSLNDAECSLNDTKCSLYDAKYSLNHAKCSLNDAKCSLNDLLFWVFNILNKNEQTQGVDLAICDILKYNRIEMISPLVTFYWPSVALPAAHLTPASQKCI